MKQLAKKFGVTPSMVSRILSGRRMPSAKLLIIVAHELEITVEELYQALNKKPLTER